MICSPIFYTKPLSHKSEEDGNFELKPFQFISLIIENSIRHVTLIKKMIKILPFSL